MSLLNRLGRGWDFPVRPDPRAGALAYTGGPEKVRQSIGIILDTEPGERIMRPSFGCGLRRYLGEPNTVAVRALIRHDVEQAIVNHGMFEKRKGPTVTATIPDQDQRSFLDCAVF